ncbi:MAG: hypothetical protein GDA48_29020 [Hormoscilla sp. GM102CHS1]|nr:hypothetical protein [Hormoscilla sp. GM102CHS1]
MTTAYQPVAGCGESRKSGSERKDWGATPSSIPDDYAALKALYDNVRFVLT